MKKIVSDAVRSEPGRSSPICRDYSCRNPAQSGSVRTPRPRPRGDQADGENRAKHERQPAPGDRAAAGHVRGHRDQRRGDADSEPQEEQQGVLDEDQAVKRRGPVAHRTQQRQLRSALPDVA